MTGVVSGGCQVRLDSAPSCLFFSIFKCRGVSCRGYAGVFCSNRGVAPSFGVYSCTVNFGFLSFNSECVHVPFCATCNMRRLTTPGIVIPRIILGHGFYDFMISGTGKTPRERHFFRLLSRCGRISSKNHCGGGMKNPIPSGATFVGSCGFGVTFRGDVYSNCAARGVVRPVLIGSMPVC